MKLNRLFRDKKLSIKIKQANIGIIIKLSVSSKFGDFVKNIPLFILIYKLVVLSGY